MKTMTPKNSRRPAFNRRSVLCGAAGVLAVAAAVGTREALHAAAASRGLVSRTRAGVAFLTPVAITVAGEDGPALDAALSAGFAALREVENASSVYRADSDLSRLNRAGRIAHPNPHLLRLVDYALHLAKATDGAYDPTVQPLWDVWAAHAARGTRPGDADLRLALASVDWTGVIVDDRRIRFDRAGMALTLNSIAQGYAADVVMAVLVQRGVAHAFIDTGEFGARGHHPDGRDWRLGVVDPRQTADLAFTIDPFRRFAATSGDYKTAFSPDFSDHHIFNPTTGRSPRDWSSITVTAPSGLVADGLSTALFALPPEKCRALLRANPGCGAHFFDKAGAAVLLPVSA